MRIAVKSSTELGDVVRQVRKAQRIRQDDLAAQTGTNHVTLKQLERGASGVAISRVFAVMMELGIRIELDIPDRLLTSKGRAKRQKPETGPP